MSSSSSSRQPSIPPWIFGAMLGALMLAFVLIQAAIPSGGGAEERVFINEFLAINRSGLTDEDGEYSDWIELFNAGARPVNLDGWSLTDTFRNLQLWRFPAVTIQPGEYRLVFASGKNRRDANGELHTSFKLSDRGEYLALVRADGRTIAHDFAPRYPRQEADISFGLNTNFFRAGVPDKSLPQDHRFFQTPTPGAPNTDEVSAWIVDPKFSVKRGFYDRPVKVEITSRTLGAQIYYTTNGAAPTEKTGQLYTGPVRVVTTTTLRAAAFKPGFVPTKVETHTYIFTKDVLQQTGAGFPATWGLNDHKPVPADYEMDPEIVTNAAYRAQLEPALRALPTLSLVMDRAQWFDTADGIYANPRESGGEWERPGSAELIFPDGSGGFHVNCGLRIQGGWNRRPEECPKHSLRLMFKKKYGTTSLQFPLFGTGGVQKFSTLILRGGCNNTWLHWSGEERRRGDYLRDQWMRESYAAMGRLSARGRFVHVYLNGLYWGLYDLVERPDAQFLAANDHGVAREYDSRNGDHVLSGDTEAWNKLFLLANAGLKSDAGFQAVQELLDVPAFIDYMILNFYGANGDWDHASNWYAGRRREPAGKFQFLVWDGERTLETVDGNILSGDDDQSPLRLFQRLRENAEFRRQFAARVRLHCFNGGALTPESAAARWRVRMTGIDTAIVAESARWGDYRRDVHPYRVGPYELYTRDDHWRPEMARLAKDFFPKRTAVMLEQFRAAGLFPAASP